MKQKDFIRTLYTMEVAKLNLDSHIWDIFEKYIKLKGILFNGPETWEQEDDEIIFRGEDGCMGCYESTSLSIPMKFFEDENALEELAIQKINEKNKSIKKKKATKLKRDLAEFLRLKKEFGC